MPKRYSENDRGAENQPGDESDVVQAPKRRQFRVPQHPAPQNKPRDMMRNQQSELPFTPRVRHKDRRRSMDRMKCRIDFNRSLPLDLERYRQRTPPAAPALERRRQNTPPAAQRYQPQTSPVSDYEDEPATGRWHRLASPVLPSTQYTSSRRQ